MPGTIYGTGRKRRDDVLNRVMDTIFKGQSIPLGGHSNPAIMAQLMSATSISQATVIDLQTSGGGNGLITCNRSVANGPDVCG